MKLSLTEYQNELISTLVAAEEKGWISAENAKNIQSQITKDKLTIGVVGQMNVGKSTLVNALVFGKNALPTSETPMTAALTYITYGETPSASVEMLSAADFKEIKEIAQRDATTEEDDETEILSAKKIITKIESISSFEELLGKTINISLDDFDKYVGAEGKYTPLVKYMNLVIDNSALKGICIVDTPGYNDPVTSRDITTKRFLSQANVIIMVQDVENHFSKPDVELIKTQIPNSGIGKMIIALNKKDSVSLSDLEKVMANASDHKTEIIQKEPEVSSILEPCKIIPVSSIMSLLGQIPKEDIKNDDALSFWNSEIECYFPNLDKDDYIEESGLLSLQKEISDIVLKQKREILLKAPSEKLQALLQACINKMNIEKDSLEETNDILSDQQIDIESVMADLNAFEVKVTGFMDDTVSGCDNLTTNKIENTRYALRDDRDGEVQNINFIEKKSKKYLRFCFNEIEDVYFRLNNSFSNTLRQLGNDISDGMHEEIAELERKMNLVVLENSQLIHASVIKRISKSINNSIPRTIGENQDMSATFPDYWDRQDIYQIGIRTYFRKMVQDSFTNEYINSITSVYENASSKLLDTIEKEIGDIIDDTKKQYDASDAIEIEQKIATNKERILEINQSIPKVLELKNKVAQLIQ